MSQRSTTDGHTSNVPIATEAPWTSVRNLGKSIPPPCLAMTDAAITYLMLEIAKSETQNLRSYAVRPRRRTQSGLRDGKIGSGILVCSPNLPLMRGLNFVASVVPPAAGCSLASMGSIE